MNSQMKTEIIDPLTDMRWIEYINSQQGTNIFHHPAWARVVSRQYNLTPQAFCVVKDQKIISGFLFIISKGILGGKFAVTFQCSEHLLIGMESSTEEIIDAFLRHLKSLQINQVEFRDNIYSTYLHSKLRGYAHSLKLDNDIDTIYNSFKAETVSRNIRKAIKEGLTYEVCSDIKSIEDYHFLHIKTRKKLGASVQSKDFFIKFWKEIISKDLGYIISVKKGNIPLSVGIFAGFNNTLSYKFGASNPDSLKLRPNNLMLWGAIQEAKKRGYTKFEMGRTDCNNDGLRNFKLGWGCTETPLHFSYYPNAAKTERLQNINSIIISPIIKNSPEFVCRIIGALAFKFFPWQFI